MYDTLQAILGLDQLIDAERRLTGARKHLDEISKTARQALPDLLSRLATHPDERARQAQAALSGRRWDLGAVDALAVGEQQADTGIPGSLHQIITLELPKPEAVNAAAERLAKSRAGTDRTGRNCGRRRAAHRQPAHDSARPLR